MGKFWQSELTMPPCVFCVVCCAFVRCALCVLSVCNVLVLVCHADPSPLPLGTTHSPRMYVQNASPFAHSKRPCVYRHYARKCYHMRAWCRYTQGRFECTHGEGGEEGFSACHTTPHAHTTTTTTYTQDTTIDGDRDRERQRKRDRERETEVF